MKRNIFITSIISTILLSSSLLSQNIKCTGSHCKIDLNNLQPMRNTIKNIITFTVKDPITTTQANREKSSDFDFIALEASKYLMSSEEILELEGEKDVMVLAHSKYIAQQGETLEYEEEPSIIKETVEKIEDKILNKSLPQSTRYCANEKKIIYHKDSNSYECA